MKPLFFSTLFGLALTAAGLAYADENARYQLQPTPNGVVRLDTHTGELAYCHESASALICAPATSDAALLGRIEMLEARVASLEAKPPADNLPSDEELEKGFSIMEKFMRRFKGLVEEFKAPQDGRPNDALPQKS